MHTLLLVFWWIYVVGYVAGDIIISRANGRSWPYAIVWSILGGACFIYISLQLRA